MFNKLIGKVDAFDKKDGGGGGGGSDGSGGNNGNGNGNSNNDDKDDESTQLQVSVESLRPSDKEGYITKRGLRFKTWKRRLFVLKGNKIWYFEGPNDTVAKGFILLTPKTRVTIDEAQKSKKVNMLLIDSIAVR